MSEIKTITFDPRESCVITLDHYVELYKKANDYDNIMELVRNYESKKGDRTKWHS